MAATMPRASNAIRRHGKKWEASYYDAHGKRRWVSGPTLESTKRAIAELRLGAFRARRGLDAEPERLPPVQRLVEEYLAERGRSWSPKHAAEVKEQLDRMLSGTIEVRTITSAWLARRRGMVAESLSNRTANKLAESVLTWLRWCEATSRVSRAPAIRIESLPEAGEHVRRRRRALSIEECRKVLDAAAATPIGPLVALLLGTGLRLSQALSLRWRDYHDGAVHVRAAVQGSRKARRALTVPVPPWLADRLAEARKVAGRVLGHLPTEDDAIVLSPRGLSLDRKGGPERCYRWFAGWKDWRVIDGKRVKVWKGGILARAGLPRTFPDGTSIDWHALRHSYATHLAAGGATAAQIQRLLGHATIAQASVYVHGEGVPVDTAVAGLPSYGGNAVATEAKHA